jgi:hypothetical protein
MLLGMDAIVALGGININRNGEVLLNRSLGLMARERLCIEDTDFQAVFLCDRWVVKWNWKEND